MPKDKNPSKSKSSDQAEHQSASKGSEATNNPNPEVSNNNLKKHDRWLSIYAIAISVISLTWNIINQLYQNARIDALNEPKIVVDSPFLNYYNTISPAARDTTNWGYSFFAYHERDDTWHIPYQLAVYDSNGHRLNNNFGFAIKEVEKQLALMSYHGKFTVYEAYNPVISLKNIGQTDAFKLNAFLAIKMGPYMSTPWTTVEYVNSPINLYVNEKVSPPLELTCEVHRRMPDSIYYRIDISYRDMKNKCINEQFYWAWSQSDDVWSRFTNLDELKSAESQK